MQSWKLRIYQEERKDFREQLEWFHPGHKVFFFIGFHYTLPFFFPYSQRHYFFWIRVGKEKARVCWCPMREIPVVVFSWVPQWSPQWDSLISVCYNGCCLLQLAVNNSTSGLNLWQSTPVDYIHWAHVNLQVIYDQNSFQHNGCQQPVSSFTSGQQTQARFLAFLEYSS